MASHYKRPDSAYYWISRRRPDGTFERFSTGIPVASKGAEKAVLRRLTKEREREQLQRDDGSGDMFSAWVEKWMVTRYEEGGTLVRYQCAWRCLEVFFREEGIVHPGQVTYPLAERWMQWRTGKIEGAPMKGVRKAKWNTALTDLRVLSAIMQECVRRGIVLANPVLKTGYKRRGVKVKPAITKEEEKAIFEALASRPSWMADAFLVAMCHGCRLSEVEVPPEKINVARRELVFKAKGGADFIVPMHSRVEELAARAVEDGRPLVVLGKSPSKLFCNFFDEIGMGHLSFHCTRVTVATRLRDAGVSRDDAMDYLNHSSEVIHQVYLRSDPERLRHLGDALGG